ncbi:hypothetical protein BS47DRAFT_1485191 [Hydnum rufescens UP504]|uniref:DUF6534 domain-containing protein n=1 Tax=Hydnum rufescens UP504 TaxID=1448309 RepID=A0A9P6AY80_9AGAM|nr:hypothetical protein BS47DRAFT_1485191 [Hydnum rufescens UP504]
MWRLTVPTLCTLYSVCITWSLYWWSAINYLNRLALGRATWEFLIYQITTACASVTVQTFFVYRVYSLSGNLMWACLCKSLCYFSLDSLSVGTRLPMSRLIVTHCIPVKPMFWHAAATAIRANMILDFQLIIKECSRFAAAWLIIQAIADVVIAVYMCILLRRRRTGFEKTDSVINRMVLYTISTGLITSVLSCLLLVLVAKEAFHLGVVAIGTSLGVFYSITMLANLHIRTRLRARLDTPTPLELINSSIKKRMRQNAADHRSGESPHAARINITTEVVTNVDIKPMVPVMAYVALYACFGSHKSRLFIWLYSTIRLWSIPIFVAAYGLIQKLTDEWTIPVFVICLLFVQTGGAILWTIGTVKGTNTCGPRNRKQDDDGGDSPIPVRVLPARRGVLHHLQIVSMRVHVPLVVRSATDLVAYILFPKSHISTVIAIIIGKVWSNTLLHGLNSRQALRHAPPIATILDHGIEFAPQWRQTNSSTDDSFTMELTEMGILGPDRLGHESGVPSLEQDISSVRVSEDAKNVGGGVPDCLANAVCFGEQPNHRRGGGRHGRRSSAPT